MTAPQKTTAFAIPPGNLESFPYTDEDLEPSGELPFARLVRVARSYRNLLIAMAIAGSVVWLARAFLEPPIYSSTAAFVPQSAKAQQSGLSNIAASFGVNVGAADLGQSPAFYVSLLHSREILGRVAESRFKVPDKPQERTLLELYDLKAPSKEAAFQRGAEEMSHAMTASFDRETAIVSFSIASRWPSVSLAAAQRIMNEVNEFNVRARQSSALRERQFVERRLGEAAAELRVAEERLQSFRLGNRVLGESTVPTVTRLNNDVALRRQVYNKLAENFEQSKIDEVRDTPVITVIEEPRLPVRAVSRHLVQRALVGLMVGLIAGLLAALIMDHRRQRKRAAEPLRA